MKASRSWSKVCRQLGGAMLRRRPVSRSHRAVLHGCPGVAGWLEPRPCRPLEDVEDRVDLRVSRPVVRRPGDHGRRVFVLERQRVGDGRHVVRILTEDIDALARGTAVAARTQSPWCPDPAHEMA